MIVRRQRSLEASRDEVWSVIADPERLPDWWPGVSRVEEATPEAWTKVLVSPRGKQVRADYTRVAVDAPQRVRWRQEVAESPFERILHSSETEIALEPEHDGTRVTVSIEHRPRGWARLSPFQMRAAALRQVQGALGGLAELLDGEEDD